MRHHWTNSKIIELTRTLASQNVHINPNAIKKSHPDLFRAAYRYFGNFQAVLLAAGFNPKTIEHAARSRRGKWSKNLVETRIAHIHRTEGKTGYTHLAKHHPSLCKAAIRHYGSIGKALMASGLNAAAVEKKNRCRRWSKEKIIAEIRAIASKGIRPNPKYVKRINYRLFKATQWHFGNFGKALLAAGFNPKDLESRERSRSLTRWGKDRVISQIRKLHEIKEPINAAYIRDRHVPLYRAAQKWLGSWEKAIKAAGLNYDSIRDDRLLAQYRGLVLEKLVKKIYALHGQEVVRKLLVRGKRWLRPDFFEVKSGKWVEVKLSAWSTGVEESIRDYLEHTDELLILYAKGSGRQWPDRRVRFIKIDDYFPLLRLGEGVKLRNKLEEIINSTKTAHQLKKWGKIWSKEKIISMLKKLRLSGVAINTASISKANHQLYQEAVIYFGSYRNALQAAGFDPDKIQINKRWSKYKVISKIRGLHRTGTRLTAYSLRKSHSGLVSAAHKLFGSWSLACKESNM